MPTYHDLCVEMGQRGHYITDAIGKCQRQISAFKGDGRSRIDKYLRESATFQASLKRVDLKSLFSEKRAEPAVLCWVESRTNPIKTQFPILVDEEAGIIRQPKKDFFGLLEDVEECLYRRTTDDALIPWHQGRSSDVEFAEHSDAEIMANDSSLSTIGTKLSGSTRRIGQAHWRKRVSVLCGGCCVVTGCTHPRLLRASHIKRWEHGTTDERLDAHNGLMLAAHIDAAFEVGLIRSC